MKNKKVMSMAIQPELHDEVKKAAKRKGQSTSEYIGNLVEQALKLNPDDEPIVIGKPIDEDIKQIVLRVPTDLNAEQMKQFLDVQSAGIIKALAKPTEA